MTCDEGERRLIAGKGMPFGHRFEDGTSVFQLGKQLAGRELDGRTHDEYPV